MNIVNDGLDNPLPNEHKSGDKAYVGSVGYEINNFYFAVTYSQFYQHELLAITDSTSVYFDGFGSEFYAGYTFGRDQQWRASLLMNTMWPEKDQMVDKYKMLYFVGEFSYAFGEESRIFLSIKEDFNSDRFGNSSEETIWAMGLRFSFGY